MKWLKLALIPLGLIALCLGVPVVNFVWSVVQMNLHREDFAAFDHIAAGTPVTQVVDRAKALGFEHQASFAEPDGGLEQVSFMKVVVPPFGRWFIHVTSFDGGVVLVRTTTLD